MIIDYILNGKAVSINVPPQKRLTEILREDHKLLRTRYGCRSGECGKCLVIFNGKLANSCLIPAFRLRGGEVMSIEGFEKTKACGDILEGFKIAGYYPCEFCVSSRILAAHHLLETETRPSDREIMENLSFINCTCSDYSSLLNGIREAGKLREGRGRG